uniref:DUF659 domain-containing protein n=1 Tax=Lactuca sativa TaxID=4236 RepID=A0A9R1XY42_LACSA|nr:hypothetical protein LSAT_V11C100002810 [Lactuca sativa]
MLVQLVPFSYNNCWNKGLISALWLNFPTQGKLLEAKREHLYWTPCAAHCLDLMLEDIGKKVPKVKISIKKAMLAIDYIYSYVIVVNLMRKFTKERNLLRPAVTRFAISFITLAQVHRQRQLEEYSEFCRVGKGKVVQQRSDCKKKDDYKTTFQIIDQRWECQLHKPLHAAGHFLNPGIFYKDIVGVACKDVEQGWINTGMEKDYSVILWLLGIGKQKHQASYGSSVPNLKKFAIRVLSLTCSATSCERNYRLHTKKRNRLAQSRLNDMVFVKINRALDRRIKDKEKDPILLQEIDESNEWLMGKLEDENDDDIVFVVEDLTWRDVAHASGAYEPSYLTRLRVQNEGAGPSGI